MAKASIDNRLIAQCLAGERAAWRALYDRSLPCLSLVAKRYLDRPDAVADVLQESYVSIFQHLGQYDAGRAAFTTWASRIVIHRCLRWNAKNRKAAVRDLNAELDPPCVKPTVISDLSNTELIAFLRNMPQSYYTVFSLYVIDGHDHAEIAELLDITPALSRQRLVRARAWLRKHLPEEYKLGRSRNRRIDPLALPLVVLLLQFIQ